MPFQKVLKTKEYFRRYQVKYRRRRQGKTDYRRRRILTVQDKNKYNSPKYRFVVRITNRDVVCQVVMAKMVGDHVLAAAYSHELPRYGVTVGLTNYAAVYCTGLLCARRLLAKLNMADQYEGNTELNGDVYLVEPTDEGGNPFYCFLDVGLAATTTGARVFAALKGACDGGLEIPHNEKRFAGYDTEAKEHNADTMRKYLVGGHIADYMRQLAEDDDAAYQRQFARYIKAGIKADDLEDLYTKAHAKIREDPSPAPKKKASGDDKKRVWPKGRRARLSYAQRKDRIRQKLESRARDADA